MAAAETFAASIYGRPNDFIGEEQQAKAFRQSLLPKPEKPKDVKQYEDDFDVYYPYQDLYLGAAREIITKGEEEAGSLGDLRQSISIDRNRRWQDLKKIGKQTEDLKANAADLYEKMNNPKYSEQQRQQMAQDYERIVNPPIKGLKWDEKLKTNRVVSEDPEINGKPWYEVMRPVEYPDPVEKVDWLKTAFDHTQPDKFGARTPRVKDGVEIGGTQDFFSKPKAIKAFNALMKSGTPAAQDIIKGGIEGYLTQELGVNRAAVTPQMIESYLEDEEALSWVQDTYVENAEARYKASVTPARAPSDSGSGYLSQVDITKSKDLKLETGEREQTSIARPTKGEDAIIFKPKGNKGLPFREFRVSAKEPDASGVPKNIVVDRFAPTKVYKIANGDFYVEGQGKYVNDKGVEKKSSYQFKLGEDINMNDFENIYLDGQSLDEVFGGEEELPEVTTEQDYAALPKGAKYMYNGQEYTKE